jgi:thiamine-phosphate pyrophosphorylase
MNRLGFRLYAITDRRQCAPASLIQIVRSLLDAGVKGIQLREKDLDDTESGPLAEEIAGLCGAHGAKLFINSRIGIALDVRASGVHLPANAPSVREMLERDHGRLIIGCSVHSLEEARKREEEGADFVTFSPVYGAASKPGYGPAAGIEKLAEVSRAVRIPVFALGGITPERVAECLRAGAYGVAVMSGLMSAEGAGQRAALYLRQFGR